MYNMVEPCSDSGAYVAEPDQDIKIDMDEVEKRLEKEGYEFKFSSEVIHLVLDKEVGEEIGIYPSGKLLFKTTDTGKVDQMFERLSKIMEEVISS
ncbi:MAG: hypothetical protein ACOC53_05675 [Candidatus Saliniplasma sp.]